MTAELRNLRTALLARHDVRQACVVRFEDEARIVAFLVTDDQPDHGEIHDYLTEKLPGAPTIDLFVQLDDIPDGVDMSSASRGGSGAGPHILDGIAGQVADIWREVLDLPSVRLGDDFFALGGHSLSVTRMAVRIRSRLGVDVPLEVFYDTPSVVGIAATIAHSGSTG